MRGKKHPGSASIARAVFLSFLLILAAAPLTSCGDSEGGLEAERGEGHPPKVQSPGTLVEGLYLSRDGRFAVHADQEHWEPDRENPDPGLRNKKENSISITFSWVEGLNRKTIEHFSDRFVDSYLEEIRLLYPNVKKEDCRIVDDFLAELDMSMTDETGSYPMVQMLWLATDGENGCIVTAALPGDAAAKDTANDTVKDTVNDTVKDTANDTVKDTAKDTVKDTVNDTAPPGVQKDDWQQEVREIVESIRFLSDGS